MPRAVRKRSHDGVASRFVFLFFSPVFSRAVPPPRARGRHLRGRFPFRFASSSRDFAPGNARDRLVRVRGVRVAQRARELPRGEFRRGERRRGEAGRGSPGRAAVSLVEIVVEIGTGGARLVVEIVVVRIVLPGRRAHPHARGHVPVQVVPQAERAVSVAPPAEERAVGGDARAAVARRRHGDD